MQARIRKWGNSLALRIPESVANDLGLTAGSRVDLYVHEGRLEAIPVADGPLLLGELLSAVTENNIHGEHDTGKSIGREDW